MQEKSLSERQKEILAEIIKFKKENGFSPTVRELCANWLDLNQHQVWQHS